MSRSRGRLGPSRVKPAVSVGADMMQKKNPKSGDEDSASLETYLDASRIYD